VISPIFTQIAKKGKNLQIYKAFSIKQEGQREKLTKRKREKLKHLNLHTELQRRNPEDTS